MGATTQPPDTAPLYDERATMLTYNSLDLARCDAKFSGDIADCLIPHNNRRDPGK